MLSNEGACSFSLAINAQARLLWLDSLERRHCLSSALLLLLPMLPTARGCTYVCARTTYCAGLSPSLVGLLERMPMYKWLRGILGSPCRPPLP